MTHALDDRNGAHIECVASELLESAHAALTEDNVRVALGHHVLCSQQPLLHEHGEPALEHDWLARLANLFQQQVVLGVTRADLEDVRELVDGLDVRRGHHLGDDRHARLFARGRQDLQAAPAQAPELVG